VKKFFAPEPIIQVIIETLRLIPLGQVQELSGEDEGRVSKGAAASPDKQILKLSI
jgi:hypothetical protein